MQPAGALSQLPADMMRESWACGRHTVFGYVYETRNHIMCHCDKESRSCLTRIGLCSQISYISTHTIHFPEILPLYLPPWGQGSAAFFKSLDNAYRSARPQPGPQRRPLQGPQRRAWHLRRRLLGVEVLLQQDTELLPQRL